MPITATLVKYHNELWMCDINSQPTMLYKNWYDLKSRMRGTYINDVDVPEIFACGNTASKVSAVVWTDDQAIPDHIAVTAMSYRKSRTRNVWKLSKDPCFDKTPHKGAWKHIQARIRARAPDTDFKSGPCVCFGYIQTPISFEEREYLKITQQASDTPVFTFAAENIAQKPSNFVFAADTDDLVCELLCLAWLNTRPLYQNHKLLMTAPVLYMPHSVILPSTNVLWNPFSECWYYVK